MVPTSLSESHRLTSLLIFRLQEDGIFKWVTHKQGVILASFYYGFILTPFLGGVLAMKFGGKLLILVGLTLMAVLTILTPVLTIVGDFPMLVALRVMEGIGQVYILLNIVSMCVSFCLKSMLLECFTVIRLLLVFLIFNAYRLCLLSYFVHLFQFCRHGSWL